MAYTKTNWIDNQTAITADKMNNIENGIENVNGDVYHATYPKACAMHVRERYEDNTIGAWDFGALKNLVDEYTFGSEYFEPDGDNGILVKKDCYAYCFADVVIHCENGFNTDTGILIMNSNRGNVYASYDRQIENSYVTHSVNSICSLKAGDHIQIMYMNGAFAGAVYTVLPQTHFGLIYIGEV